MAQWNGKIDRWGNGLKWNQYLWELRGNEPNHKRIYGMNILRASQTDTAD